MVYYPFCRKIIAVFGILCLGIAAALTYKYIGTSKIIYAIFDVIAVGFAVFLLVPILGIRVVTIVDDTIIVSRYGRKYDLTVDDFEKVSYREGDIISYRFLRDGRRYQITPFLYANSEEMQGEFIRILEDRSKEPQIDIKPWLYKGKEHHYHIS